MKWKNPFRSSKRKDQRQLEPRVSLPESSTFVHITHGKAASQWMRAILKDLFSPAVVEPDYGARSLLEQSLKPGHAYPCCNLGRPEFEQLDFKAPPRSLVLIRDLRDTLVSAYFSFRHSHELATDQLKYYHWFLNRLEQEQGLLYLAETWLHRPAWIQRSWASSGSHISKIEDCVKYAPGQLAALFRKHWQLDIEPSILGDVVERRSFAKLSGGRQPGQQDVSSHYRKGVAGDWRKHFTPLLARRFEQLYGELLLLTGYETEPGWSEEFAAEPRLVEHPTPVPR